MKYIAYFDCGTTNSRIYVLDEALNPVFSKKSPVGSKDNVISGDSSTLTAGMHALYVEALSELHIVDADIAGIYASGMVSSAYGLYELPHCELPISVEAYSQKLYPYEEKLYFNRIVYLAPGIKRLDEDFDYVNNLRGEEMEAIGLMELIAQDYPGQTCAVALPGSHTHVIFVRDGMLLGIVSNLTGEIFHAVASETLLAPVLTAPFESLEPEWILKGIHNLDTFGFNRALYISHAMKIFNEATPVQRLSYSEGVLFGGIAKSVEHYCNRLYTDCRIMLTVADPLIGGLYQTIFSTVERFSVNRVCTADAALPYTVRGLRKILQAHIAKE